MLAGCSEAPAEETEIKIEKIYDTGKFRVPVPEGWRVIPITDPFAEGRPVKTDCVFLRKGGESDWNAAEKPYIRIEQYSPDDPMEAGTVPELWRDVEEIQPMTFGDLVWYGYTGDDYHGRANIGRFAVLWTEPEGYQLIICFESGGDSISLEDRDLQAILAGILPSESGQ